MTYLPCIANVYLRCHMYQATAFNRKILYSNQIKSYLTCHNCRFICPPQKKIHCLMFLRKIWGVVRSNNVFMTWQVFKTLAQCMRLEN